MQFRVQSKTPVGPMHFTCVDRAWLQMCQKTYLRDTNRRWADAGSSVNPWRLLVRCLCASRVHPTTGAFLGGERQEGGVEEWNEEEEGQSHGWGSPGRRLDLEVVPDSTSVPRPCGPIQTAAIRSDLCLLGPYDWSMCQARRL